MKQEKNWINRKIQSLENFVISDWRTSKATYMRVPCS